MSGGEVAEAFVKRMAHACDRTRSHKTGVIVSTADWHALMDLADKARQVTAHNPPAAASEVVREAISKYYPLPFSFHEYASDVRYGQAAFVRDANGGSVAMLMWPAHDPEDEDEAVAATYAVGRAFAAALATASLSPAQPEVERTLLHAMLDRFGDQDGAISRDIATHHPILATHNAEALREALERVADWSTEFGIRKIARSAPDSAEVKS